MYIIEAESEIERAAQGNVNNHCNAMWIDDAYEQIRIIAQRPVALNKPLPDVIAYKHILAILIIYFNGPANALIE